MCGVWADCPPHPHPVPALAPSGTAGLANLQVEPRNPPPPSSRAAGPHRNPAQLCKGRNNPRGLTPRRTHSVCPELLWPPPSKPRPELTTLPRPRNSLVRPRQPLGGRLSPLPVSAPSQPRLARGALKLSDIVVSFLRTLQGLHSTLRRGLGACEGIAGLAPTSLASLPRCLCLDVRQPATQPHPRPFSQPKHSPQPSAQ